MCQQPDRTWYVCRRFNASRASSSSPWRAATTLGCALRSWEAAISQGGALPSVPPHLLKSQLRPPVPVVRSGLRLLVLIVQLFLGCHHLAKEHMTSRNHGVREQREPSPNRKG